MTRDRDKHILGNVQDFPEGSCRVVEVRGRSIGVYNIDGVFYAVRNSCPHQLAPICSGPRTGTMRPSAPGEFVWTMDGFVLRCPRHGWEFDIRSGEALFGIDRRRLVTFSVGVEENTVVIFLQKSESRETGSVEASA